MEIKIAKSRLTITDKNLILASLPDRYSLYPQNGQNVIFWDGRVVATVIVEVEALKFEIREDTFGKAFSEALLKRYLIDEEKTYFAVVSMGENGQVEIITSVMPSPDDVLYEVRSGVKEGPQGENIYLVEFKKSGLGDGHLLALKMQMTSSSTGKLEPVDLKNVPLVLKNQN